jgi:hypothetical protein
MEEIIFWLFAPVAIGAGMFAAFYLVSSQIGIFFKWFGGQSDESFSGSSDDL